MLLPIFKIETLGAVDGPGLRLVIFTQGCPYRCIYCHNPESWEFNKNKTISFDELIKLYNKNKSFYKNGGITLSGGEPLLHGQFCLKLAKYCYDKKISLAFDTACSTFNAKNISFFKKLIKFKPLFIIDIKALTKIKHKKITGFSDLNDVDFIHFLELNKKDYWLRYVLVENITDTKRDLISLTKFVKGLKYIKNFQFLPFHNMGMNKYINLKFSTPLLKSPNYDLRKYITLKEKMKIFPKTL